jgi:metal-responsive CopG/Arc/MetJ family transcriptional regulator
MQRMQVYIPEKLFTHLKSRAAIEEVSMSDLVRKGLRVVLKHDETRKADPMKVFVGQGRIKGKTDAVKEIKRYYQKSSGK